MSGDTVRAVQGWRWMPSQPTVQQSFIVRVPEAELEAELARQRAATAALPGWLPTPRIVEVPARLDGPPNVDARRWLAAAHCVRSVLDEFFVEAGYGDWNAAGVLGERIATKLDQEGRLS